MLWIFFLLSCSLEILSEYSLTTQYLKCFLTIKLQVFQHTQQKSYISIWTHTLFCTNLTKMPGGHLFKLDNRLNQHKLYIHSRMTLTHICLDVPSFVGYAYINNNIMHEWKVRYLWWCKYSLGTNKYHFVRTKNFNSNHLYHITKMPFPFHNKTNPFLIPCYCCWPSTRIMSSKI